MKTFKSLAQIAATVAESSHPVFVRWSQYPRRDIKRGYSINHASGQAEAGLSVNELHDDDSLAQQLTEYAHFGGQCWLLTGEIVGRGSDNEVVVSGAEFIGNVSGKAIEEAQNAYKNDRTQLILRWAERLQTNEALYGRVAFVREVARMAAVYPEDVRKALGI